MPKKFSRLFNQISTFRFNSKSRKKDAWRALYRTLSYHFKNESLLQQALTHRSLTRHGTEKYQTNERLEFLGDAVLGMVVTHALYHHFPETNEGELTKAKSLIVSRDVLADQAKTIGLGDYLYLGKGEEHSGGRQRDSNLANAFEALVGAMYLDGGLEVVTRFIRDHLLKNLDHLLSHRFHNNFKSWLLEYIQSTGDAFPEYHVLNEAGPDHKKEFSVGVFIQRKMIGKGKGFNKKKAEQEAARHALLKLGLIK